MNPTPSDDKRIQIEGQFVNGRLEWVMAAVEAPGEDILEVLAVVLVTMARHNPTGAPAPEVLAQLVVGLTECAAKHLANPMPSYELVRTL